MRNTSEIKFWSSGKWFKHRICSVMKLYAWSIWNQRNCAKVIVPENNTIPASQGSVEKQNQYDRYRYMRWFLMQLTLVIMEAKKFHYLPFVSWRTKKAGSIIQSKPEDLRILWGGGNSINPKYKGIQRPESQKFWGQKAGKDGYPSSRERKNLLFFYLFVLFPSSVDGWCPQPNLCFDRDRSLYLVYWFKC